MRIRALIITILLLVPIAILANLNIFFPAQTMSDEEIFKKSMKEKLPPDVFRIMYESGTERPFSSPLNDEHRSGVFVTADTGLQVFRSEDKFDSGTGWPSFVKPIDGAVVLKDDNSLFTKRIEVVSTDTGAHLGHVFDDGPADRGGKRYCMNGLALKFIPDDAAGASPTPKKEAP